MNVHFISFLFDVSIWVVLGFFAGKEVYSHHLTRSQGKIGIQLLYAVIALITGSFAVLTGGLPESGIAVESLFYVAFTLLIFTMIRYPRFRTPLFKSTKTVKNRYIIPHPIRHT